MRKPMGLVALLAATAMLVPSVSYADTTTYVAAPLISSTFSPSVAGQNVSPLGGYRFLNPTTSKVKVVIKDAALTPVPFSVCQELETDPANGDTNLCGDHANDNDLGYHCDDVKTITGVKIGQPVAIFIFSADALDCPDGLGTAGTLTVTSVA